MPLTIYQSTKPQQNTEKSKTYDIRHLDERPKIYNWTVGPPMCDGMECTP